MDRSKLWISQLVSELIYYSHIWKNIPAASCRGQAIYKQLQVKQDSVQLALGAPVHSICAAAGGTWSHINQSRVK